MHASQCDRYYVCAYNKDRTSFLNSLCDKYGSDKGEIATSGHPYDWISHSYADFYERQFGAYRKLVTNVFECGIGSNNPAVASNMGADGKPGASLRVWRDYFPNAQIVGADIDRDILFNEDRIRSVFCDQTDPQTIAEMWHALAPVKFDIMIDDGLHTYDAGACLFEHSFHMLKPGGLYIIEDVLEDCLEQFGAFLTTKRVNWDYVTLYGDGVPSMRNSLVLIRNTADLPRQA